MGCCFSSTTTKADQKNSNPTKPRHSPLKPPVPQPQETPPPPPEEEETVIKEVLVLSETPALPSKTQTEVSAPEHQQGKETSDLSHLSESYSIAETISTTTTTASATKGLKEDEATSKANSEVKQKSPAKVIKKRTSNGEPAGARARRVDTSPDKKARGRGRGLAVGSRSRSPGTRRPGGVGRGATAEKSPTTVTEINDNKRPVGAATVESQSERKDDGNGDVLDQQQVTESLENPLVSLECFIFL